jgi:hypothetical protein
MSDHDGLSDFERRLRDSLHDSVDGLDGATRSRLTRARHAALDAAQSRRVTVGASVLAGAGGRPGWLSMPALLPAAAAAAALLAVVLVLNRGGGLAPGADGDTGIVFQDIELLADNDGIALTEEEDFEFLEWAVAVEARSGS